MAGRFSVEAVFKAVDRITAPVSRMQNRIQKFTRGATRGFHKLNRSVNSFGRGIKRGALVAVGSLALVGTAMAGVINTGAEFEQTLVNAAVKFPGEIRKGTKAFDELQKTAERVGSTTEFTATQSAHALNFLAMAGFSAEASIRALPGVVDLATVAQIDLALASDIATDSLGALNMLSKDAAKNQQNLTRITDVFALSTVRANLSVEEMFEAIKQGGPVGIAAGQSLETIATFAAKMADAGIKGTRAGTGLKRIFLALNAPGSAAAKVMERLGIKTANADGSIRDAIAVFKDFKKATDRLPDSSRLRVFNEIFGKIPLAAAINLTNAADGMESFRLQLQKATGTTVKMAAVMRDTFRGRLNSLKSAIEGVTVRIFGLSEGPMADLIDKTIAWVRANKELIATNVAGAIVETVEGIDKFVEKVTLIAKVTAGFLAFAVVVKTLIALMTLFNLVVALNPIFLVAAGIAAAATAMVALINNIDGINAGFDRMPNLLQLALFPIKGILVAIKGIKMAMEGLGNLAGAFAVGGVGGVMDHLFGEDEQAPARQTISPQDRTARTIEESRSLERGELTIKDESGRAQVGGNGKLPSSIKLQQSGAM